MKKHLQHFLNFLLFIPGILLAQSTRNINGKVTNSEGLPLEGVYVSVTNSGINTFTDSLGIFSLANLPGSSVQLVFEKENYFMHTLFLSRSNESTVEVKLTENYFLMNTVVISSKKNPDQIFEKGDILLRPVSSSQDLLRLVPGLFIAQHTGGGKAEQIFLRGFDVDHGTDFAIFVDGMPVNMTSHAHGQGYADLHFLIPETVGALDVSKGPHNAAYGDLATAGAGEFSTINSIGANQVKTEWGMFGTKRLFAMVNLLQPKKRLFLNKENLYVAGEYKFTNSYFTNKQHYNRFNLFTKYSGQFKNGDWLSFSASTFHSTWDASGQIPLRKVLDNTISFYGSLDTTEGGTTSRTNINLIHNKKLKNGNWKNQIFYNRYDFNLFSNFTFYLNDSVNGDQINQVDGRNMLGFNSVFQKNHRFKKLNMRSKLGTGLRYDNATIQLNNSVQREFLSRKSYGKLNQINSWFYADETWYITNKLKLNASLRTDLYQFNFKNFVNDSASGNKTKAITNPKLNLYYNPNTNVQLFAKSGFGFHSNDARAVVVGNLNNTLARAFGNEIGTIAKLTKGLVMCVSLWQLDLESELVYVGDEGVVEIAGRTRRIGVDLGFRSRISNALYADLDFNINKGRLRDEPEGANFIPLAPSFTSIGGFTYKSEKGISGSLRYRFMGDRAAIEDYSIVAKGYFLVDANIIYARPKYQLGLSVENLLNRQWKESQFATESRLRQESTPVNELHFTAGSPLFIKTSLAFFF